MMISRIVLILSLGILCYSRVSMGLNISPCISKQTCGDCITAHPDCSWCSQKDFTRTRCDYTTNLHHHCADEHIVTPNQGLRILKDQDLGNEEDGGSVHIRPQKIHLKLRPNTPLSLNVQYRHVYRQYRPISEDIGKVEIKDNAGSNIEVTYHSTCLGDKIERTINCTGLEVGTDVTFQVNFEITSCPKNLDEWDQTFQIYPVGVNTALNVHIEMICKCDCEKLWNKEVNSEMCSFNGDYECGICSCNSNAFGRMCECITDSSIANHCYDDNDTRPCSGRGDCICGICQCFNRPNPVENIYGQFCECDNFSCDRFDGKLCSGPDHGVCDCGECSCSKDWTGPECSCSTSIEDCIQPGTDEICSGHGDCECNQCKCHDTEEVRYMGPYCEDTVLF